MRNAFTAILIWIVCSLPPWAVALDMYPITEADKNFLAETVDAIGRNDMAWIAGRMVYPLSVRSSPGEVVKTKEEFMPILARELTESVRTKIALEAKEPLFKNWKGVMVADGMLWFSTFQHGDKYAKYGIFSIGLFAFQPEAAQIVSATRAEQHPWFQLDASAKRKLVQKATALKVGNSFQTVTNALGVPTVDQKLTAKESDRIIGRTLKYYAVIWERGLVNESHDQLVDVTLDGNDRVGSIRIRVTSE